MHRSSRVAIFLTKIFLKKQPCSLVNPDEITPKQFKLKQRMYIILAFKYQNRIFLTKILLSNKNARTLALNPHTRIHVDIFLTKKRKTK